MEFPSLPFIARNAIADDIKTGLDHYKIWDYLTGFLAEKGLIPKSTVGKLGALHLMSVAGAIVDLNLGGDSIVAKILTDTPSAVGSRMFSDIGLTPPPQTSPREIAALFLMEPATRAAFLGWYRSADQTTQANFRDQWQHWIANQLAVFAGLSAEDKKTLLDLKAPSAPGPSAVGTFFDRLARAIDPFPGQ